MKRLILFAAVALAFSTGAIAQNGTVKSTAAKLSDAQLDQVTAAGAPVRIQYNPGKHEVQQDPTQWVFASNCVNCTTFQDLASDLGTGGLIIRTSKDGTTSVRAIGNWRGLGQ